MRIKYLKSPNYIAFKNRRNIQSIVIHYTGMRSLQSAVERLLSKKYEVSSHYVIGRTGKILQLVKDNNIAWHEGVSNWFKKIFINRHVKTEYSSIDTFIAIRKICSVNSF